MTFSLEGCNTSNVTHDGTSTYETDIRRLASGLADSLQNDPDLTAVVAAWPELPEAVRAGIVAMVKSVGEGKA